MIEPPPLSCPGCGARVRVVGAERGIARSVAGRLRRLTAGRCPACGAAIVALADVPGVLPKELGLAAALVIDRGAGGAGPPWLQNARDVACVAIATLGALASVWLRFAGLAFAVALLLPASVLVFGAFVTAYTWRSRAARGADEDPDATRLRAADLEGARLDLAPDPRTYRGG